MVEQVRGAQVDYATLASYMAALGYPARLQLLHMLRLPHKLAELRLGPLRGRGGAPARTSARETVRHHLDKLVEVGLVRAETLDADGRAVNRYTVNPQKLYAITEELRALSTIYHLEQGAADATGTLGEAVRSTPVEGPHLVLVHGVYEGKVFPLAPTTSNGGRWVLGRNPGLAVCLDYDPFVSVENSALTKRGDGFYLTDLPGSKNGTSVNWVRLPMGEHRRLKAGDVIGVGRSLLGFVAE